MCYISSTPSAPALKKYLALPLAHVLKKWSGLNRDRAHNYSYVNVLCCVVLCCVGPGYFLSIYKYSPRSAWARVGVGLDFFGPDLSS